MVQLESIAHIYGIKAQKEKRKKESKPKIAL